MTQFLDGRLFRQISFFNFFWLQQLNGWDDRNFHQISLNSCLHWWFLHGGTDLTKRMLVLVQIWALVLVFLLLPSAAQI